MKRGSHSHWRCVPAYFPAPSYLPFSTYPTTHWDLTSNASGMGSSLFTRRYYRNRSCFLFLGLLICLSSARTLALHRSEKKELSLHFVVPNYELTCFQLSERSMKQAMKPFSKNNSERKTNSLFLSTVQLALSSTRSQSKEL